MDIAPDSSFTRKSDHAGKQANLLKKEIKDQPNDDTIEKTLDELLIREPRSKGR